MLFKIIESGVKYACNDYVAISQFGSFDVKPKEDQLKCAFYRAFSEANFIVQAEAALERKGARCDLLVIGENKRVAIEFKTAWAGDGWVNKPPAQQKTWLADINKLKNLREKQFADIGFFILCLIYQKESIYEKKIKDAMNNLFEHDPEFISVPTEIKNWNGLNHFQVFSWRVFGS